MEGAGRTVFDFPDAPWDFTLDMARQVWDESRHVEIYLGLLDHLGGYVGEFPETTIRGGARVPRMPPRAWRGSTGASRAWPATCSTSSCTSRASSTIRSSSAPSTSCWRRDALTRSRSGTPGRIPVPGPRYQRRRAGVAEQQPAAISTRKLAWPWTRASSGSSCSAQQPSAAAAHGTHPLAGLAVQALFQADHALLDVAVVADAPRGVVDGEVAGERMGGDGRQLSTPASAGCS